jgi:hypothetical protein
LSTATLTTPRAKGEPSYSIRRALNGQGGEFKGHRMAVSRGEFETTLRPEHANDSFSMAAGNDAMWVDKHVSRLRRRTASLNKKHQKEGNLSRPQHAEDRKGTISSVYPKQNSHLFSSSLSFLKE